MNFYNIKLTFSNGEVTTLRVHGIFFKSHDAALDGFLSMVLEAGIQKSTAADGTVVEFY